MQLKRDIKIFHYPKALYIISFHFLILFAVHCGISPKIKNQMRRSLKRRLKYLETFLLLSFAAKYFSPGVIWGFLTLHRPLVFLRLVHSRRRRLCFWLIHWLLWLPSVCLYKVVLSLEWRAFFIEGYRELGSTRPLVCASSYTEGCS